jgi:hypothetical protein
MKVLGTIFLIVGAATVIFVAVPRILPEQEEDGASWPYVLAEPASAARVPQIAEPDTTYAVGQGFRAEMGPAPSIGVTESDALRSRSAPVVAMRSETVPRSEFGSERDSAEAVSVDEGPASAKAAGCRSGSPLGSCEADCTECCCSSRCCRRLARRQTFTRSRCKSRCR